MTFPNQLNAYLLLAAFLFCIGIYGVITHRNAIGILMSIELMFNAVNINLVSFSLYLKNLTGQVYALFIIAVAGAEVAVGLAIIIMVYRHFRNLAVEEIDLLKW